MKPNPQMILEPIASAFTPRLKSTSWRAVAIASFRPGGRLTGPCRVAYVVQNSATLARIEIRYRAYQVTITHAQCAQDFDTYERRESFSLIRRLLVWSGIYL